jgi:Spy/CpxP family protein refolding chaperone
MRTTFVTLVLVGFLSLFNLSVFLSAQESGKSAAVEHMERVVSKTVGRLAWRTLGTYEILPDILMMDGEDVKRGLGLTGEQIQRLEEISHSFGSDDYIPGLQEARGRMREITRSARELTVLPEETEKELVALFEMTFPMQFEKLNAEFAEVLTPEQRRQYQEFLLASMSVLPFINSIMFDALDLTDEQRKQLQEIRKEWEPEFERLYELMHDDAMALEKKMQDALKDAGLDDEALSKMTFEERGKIINAIKEKLIRENPESKKTLDRLLKQKRDFEDRYKIRIYDILTDAQMARFTRLLNNPPGFAKKFIEARKKEFGELEKTGGWMPGPNSWQPGDPIPEGYLQQRQQRTGAFPEAEE